jgi:hypothetical protein
MSINSTLEPHTVTFPYESLPNLKESITDRYSDLLSIGPNASLAKSLNARDRLDQHFRNSAKQVLWRIDSALGLNLVDVTIEPEESHDDTATDGGRMTRVISKGLEKFSKDPDVNFTITLGWANGSYKIGPSTENSLT